jgi:hypothetical protein
VIKNLKKEEKMKKFLLVVIMIALLVPGISMALEEHDGRIKLLIHGNYLLNEESGTSLTGHLLPSANLAKEDLIPVGYVGMNFNLTKRLSLEPTVGYNFYSNKAIFSPRVCYSYNKAYFWGMVELLEGNGGYTFAQVEYMLTDYMHVGLEEESWGEWDDWDNFSHGGGPNVLFRMGSFGVDVAMHFREMPDEQGNDEMGTEFLMRVHLFMPGKVRPKRDKEKNEKILAFRH